MSAETVYSGPAKLYFNGVPFQADGVNGQINAVLEEKTTERGVAMFGRILETWDDIIGRITVTPWDSWSILGALFPAYLGVTTTGISPYTVTNNTVGAQPKGAGFLTVGTRPHDFASGSANGKAAAEIYTADGRLYNFVRGAITKHPGMKLGVGVPLFEQAEITCLGDPAAIPGASGFMLAGNAITESGASDPDGTGFSLMDFVNGKWTGNWGVTGYTALEPEDYWTLVSDVKYSPLTVQKLTRHYKFDSANFMVKGRIIGPTHTQLASKILSHTQGMVMTEGSLGLNTGVQDLVLTGPGSPSKTITLKNCEVKGAGFEFGGTRLGTGEVGFVTQQQFSAGSPTPASLIFSA
jgi:hypothetical protein